MSGATLLAVGAVSAFGAGDTAFAVGGLGERARVAIQHDEALARAGFARPIAARALALSPRAGDRATHLLRSAFDQCLARLGEVRPRWRERRIGLVIGTSSGGILTAESFLAVRARGEPVTRSLARGATYFAPLESVSSEMGVDFSPRVLVLGPARRPSPSGSPCDGSSSGAAR
jgi:3-oxoacyl-[acyl-carrier-protein] synthase-1/3-oxoacyl-[acyl-carrier-protein] synthase II